MSQLTKLCQPFPKEYLGKDDRGNDAVDHTVVVQRLLEVVGPYSMSVKEVLRSEVAPMTTRNGKEYPGGHFVTGAIVALRLTIDGQTIEVEETGGCENAAMKDGDGERLKHAVSDAIKRCGMRFGLGLHMWAQDHFYLFDRLYAADGAPSTEGEADPVPEPTATESTSGSATSSLPADEQPTENASEVGDGEAPASEEPAFKLDAAEKVRLRTGFMAKTKNDLGLDYETQTKVWMTAKYGGGWSSLNDSQAYWLHHNLMVPDGTREEKEAAAERFKKAVLDHLASEKAA